MQNIFCFENNKFELNDGGCFKRYLIVLLFFSHLLLLTGLGQKDLLNSDEPRVAGIGAQMAFSNQYVVPKLNNNKFLEKPPLYFWAEALSFKVFGDTNFAARYPSVVSATVGIVALYLLLVALEYSPFTAFFSGILLSVSSQWWSTGRTCLIDMMLAAFITVAIYFFYQLCVSKKIHVKLLWFIGFSIALGGAILSKGLVGLAIPAVALGGWLFFSNIMERKFTFTNWVLLGFGTVLSFVPTGIWVYLLCQKLGWENGGRIVVIVNNFGRFTGTHKEHIEPFYYYLKKFPEFMQPITFIIPFAVWFHFRELKKNKSPKSLFIICWTLIPYLLLTVSSAKRRVYLLPLNPAFAAMTGVLIAGLIERSIKLPALTSYKKLKEMIPESILKEVTVSNILYILGMILGPVTFLAGIGVLIAGIILKFPASSIIILSGAVCVIAATLNLNFTRKKYGIFCNLILLQILVTFTAFNSVGAVVLNKKKSSRSIFIEAKKLEKDGYKLVFYKPWDRIKGAGLFYLQEKLTEAHDLEKLKKLTAEYSKVAIISYKEEKLPGYKAIKEFKVKKDYFIIAVTDKK